MALRSPAYGWLERRSPHGRWGVCLLLLTLVGWLDHATGHEVVVSFFYLAPVSVAAWHGSRRMGLGMAVLAAATALAVDLGSGRSYSHPATAYWNAAVRLAFFLVTPLLLAQLRSQLEAEQTLARVDALTGLLNRGGLFERGDVLLRLAARQPAPLSVACIDLDDFMTVNDTRGHAEGDRLLREVAGVLAAGVRASDVVARTGGDEFVALLPQTDFAGAETAVAKLATALVRCFREGGWAVTASIGAATFATPPRDLDAALRAADALLYELKRAGKDAVRHAAVPPDPAPRGALDWEPAGARRQEPTE